jgi:hypothetical protein
MEITITEAKAIITWVEKRVGPISHEFDQPIHDFLDRVYRFVDDDSRTNDKAITDVQSENSGEDTKEV